MDIYCCACSLPRNILPQAAAILFGKQCDSWHDDTYVDSATWLTSHWCCACENRRGILVRVFWRIILPNIRVSLEAEFMIMVVSQE